jgi:hypothetical protein
MIKAPIIVYFPDRSKIAGIALRIGISLLGHLSPGIASAQMITPSAAMIREACSNMIDIFGSQMGTIKNKIGIRESQTKAWNQFVKSVSLATGPVLQKCEANFAKGAMSDDSADFKSMRAGFIQDVQDMGGHMDAAVEILKTHLDEGQQKQLDTALKDKR